MKSYSDLFTNRQSSFLEHLPTLSERLMIVVGKMQSEPDLQILMASLSTQQGWRNCVLKLSVYLAFSVSRMADDILFCRWDPNPTGYAPKIANTFGRHALPMVWDFVEGNPFSPPDLPLQPCHRKVARQPSEWTDMRTNKYSGTDHWVSSNRPSRHTGPGTCAARAASATPPSASGEPKYRHTWTCPTPDGCVNSRARTPAQAAAGRGAPGHARAEKRSRGKAP